MWRFRWGTGLTLAALAAAILAGRSLVGRSRDRPVTYGLTDVLSEEELERLDLTVEEIPPGYARLSSPAALKRLGLSRNPDYTTKPGDMEAIARLGGICSFVSAFGSGDVARVILNGVYFRDQKYFDSFVKFQMSQPRLVRAFGLSDNQGQWLLMVGIDPRLLYARDEFSALTAGLSRYQQRLALPSVFDQLAVLQEMPRELPKEP